MSDTSRLFGERLQSNLYPTTTYTNNSGGDPKDIPNLTWKQLREFHKTHYHPSNSYTLTYGDLPLEPILKFIHEEALAKFTRIVPNTDVQDEVRFSQPKEVHATCPSNPSKLANAHGTKSNVLFSGTRSR
jgi:Zn-dependent M16 (insulinase) family peptidase